MPTRWEVTKAVRASTLPAPARLVMFVLADAATVGTAEIPERHNPSLKVLAAETGLNESTVKRHLLALERDGWVGRDRPTMKAAQLHGERTRYRLLVPEGADVAQARVLTEPSEGAEEAQPGRRGSPAQGAEEAQTRAHSAPHKEDLPVLDLPDQNLGPHSGRTKAQRGTRIPANFAVTPEMREWAMANVPSLAGSRETEKFINFWRAKAGRDAVKLDWEATWRNWMLKAAEYAVPNGRASPNGLVDHNGTKLKPETAARLADNVRFQAMDQLALEGPAP